MTGKSHSEATKSILREKRKMQQTRKGIPLGPMSEENKDRHRGHVPWNKGLAGDIRVQHTEVTKGKMTGRVPWNRGKTLSC